MKYGCASEGWGEDEEPMANAESDTAEKCWQMLMSALAVVVGAAIYVERRNVSAPVCPGDDDNKAL